MPAPAATKHPRPTITGHSCSGSFPKCEIAVQTATTTPPPATPTPVGARPPPPGGGGGRLAFDRFFAHAVRPGRSGEIPRHEDGVGPHLLEQPPYDGHVRFADGALEDLPRTIERQVEEPRRRPRQAHRLERRDRFGFADVALQVLDHRQGCPGPLLALRTRLDGLPAPLRC